MISAYGEVDTHWPLYNTDMCVLREPLVCAFAKRFPRSISKTAWKCKGEDAVKVSKFKNMGRLMCTILVMCCLKHSFAVLHLSLFSAPKSSPADTMSRQETVQMHYYFHAILRYILLSMVLQGSWDTQQDNLPRVWLSRGVHILIPFRNETVEPASNFKFWWSFDRRYASTFRRPWVLAVTKLQIVKIFFRYIFSGTSCCVASTFCGTYHG